jgi:hypothetical protein
VSSTLGPHNAHRGRQSFPCVVWRQVSSTKDVLLFHHLVF